MWACVLRRNRRRSWEQVGAEAPVLGSWFLGFWVLASWGHGPSGFLSVWGRCLGSQQGRGQGPGRRQKPGKPPGRLAGLLWDATFLGRTPR